MKSEDNLTKSDCFEILINEFPTVKDFEILDFKEFELSGEKLGIMAKHCKLRIEFLIGKSNNKPITREYFLKKMISDIKIQNKMIKDQGAYKKEKFMYDFLWSIPTLDPNYTCEFIPHCYKVIPEKLFVLEDFASKGYSKCRYGRFEMDLKHLHIALDKIAQFHSSSIIYEHKQKAGYKLSDEYAEYLKDSLYRNDPEYLGTKFRNSSTNAVIAVIKESDLFSDNRAQILENFLKVTNNMHKFAGASDKFCNVICHGDLWVNNILFKYDDDNNPTDCCLIDFQAIRYTVPANDVLPIIYMSSNITDKNPQFNELILYYYNLLTKYLKKSNIDINSYMTYSQFLESIEYAKPFSIVQKTFFTTLFPALNNIITSFNEEIFNKAMYGNRSDLCLQEYKNNKNFKDVMDSALIDLNCL